MNHFTVGFVSDLGRYLKVKTKQTQSSRKKKICSQLIHGLGASSTQNLPTNTGHGNRNLFQDELLKKEYIRIPHSDTTIKKLRKTSLSIMIDYFFLMRGIEPRTLW